MKTTLVLWLGRKYSPAFRLAARGIALAALLLPGCGQSESFRSLAQLDLRPVDSGLNRTNPFVPIFDNGKLRLIVGGVKHEHYVCDVLTAITPDSKTVWTVKTKYNDRNPRPYEGKSNVKDREAAFRNAINIGDLDNDGIDDLWACLDALSLHSGIISGVSGEVIVQSKMPIRFRSPVAVFDFDKDGIKDLRFVIRSDESGKMRTVTICGKDLGLIDDTCFDVPEKSSPQSVQSMPDENADGVPEFSFQTNVNSTHSQLVIVDGMSLKIRRTVPLGKLGFAKCIPVDDLNDDSQTDLIVFDDQGARSQRDNGFISAIDGLSGAEFWYLDGATIGGPSVEVFEMERGGKKKNFSRASINLLGKNLTVIADQNGDSVKDIAVCIANNASDSEHRAIVLISGADGAILGEKSLGHTWLQSTLLVPLVPIDEAGASAVFALAGSIDGKKVTMIRVRF